MSKYVPFDKLSKKEKRKIHAKRRGLWGVLNPVTRQSKNKKAYDRKDTSEYIKEVEHDG